MAPTSARLLAALVPAAAGHGSLTKPAARNVLLNMGLTHPGASMCDITSPNVQNMNGCQGGAGPFTFKSCYETCGRDYTRTDAACRACKQGVVDTALARDDLVKIGAAPEPRLGPCGDQAGFQAMTDPSILGCGGKSCVDEALARNLDEVVLGADRSFEVQVKITAYHYGWLEFRLCPQGGVGADGTGVTQECFNQHVLRFDAADSAARYNRASWWGRLPTKGATSPTNYTGIRFNSRCDGPGAEVKMEFPEMWAPPGTCCFDGGDCGDSSTNPYQNVRWVLPSSSAGPDYTLRLVLDAGLASTLSCTQASPCTLQWTYMTGNTEDGYPEVFRNCADFKLGQGEGGASPSPAPGTAAASTTAAPAGSNTGAPTTTVSGAAVGGGACAHNTDCAASAWCDQASVFDSWCADHGVGDCPAPECVVRGSGSADPEPEPAPETSEPATTEAPTPSPSPAPSPRPTPAPTDAPTPSPSPTPSPTDAPTPSPNPTPSPTEAPTPSPNPTPTPSGGEQQCVHNTDCAASAWCKQDLDSWCADRDVGDCPAPHCVVGGPSLLQHSPEEGMRKARRHSFLGAASLMEAASRLWRVSWPGQDGEL